LSKDSIVQRRSEFDNDLNNSISISKKIQSGSSFSSQSSMGDLDFKSNNRKDKSNNKIYKDKDKRIDHLNNKNSIVRNRIDKNININDPKSNLRNNNYLNK